MKEIGVPMQQVQVSGTSTLEKFPDGSTRGEIFANVGAATVAFAQLRAANLDALKFLHNFLGQYINQQSTIVVATPTPR